jgi:hypothetical protein
MAPVLAPIPLLSLGRGTSTTGLRSSSNNRPPADLTIVERHREGFAARRLGADAYFTPVTALFVTEI